MTEQELAIITKEYPELPKWIAERAKTLDEARELMELRRSAFPKTEHKPATV